MNQLLATTIQTFQTTNYLFNKAVDDMSEADFITRPNDMVNPIQFLMGHLTLYRYHACKLLGDKTDFKYSDLYKMGSQVQDISAYPSVAEIKAEWDSATTKLMALLENVTEAQLKKPNEANYPIGEKNVMGALSFCAFHESYHIGQVGYIRKFLGYETLIG